jgi:hypothetical protein
MKRLIKIIDINLSYWWENILQLAVVLICLLTQKKAIKDLNNQLLINSFDTYQKENKHLTSVLRFFSREYGRSYMKYWWMNGYKRT